MNNIRNNSYSTNSYGTSNINIENKKIQNNMQSKITIDQLSKEELSKINNLKNPDVQNFLKRIQQEIQKAQLIAIKIVKGEKITKEELQFITKKYPDIKQIADESIKDYKNLIKVLKNCKTHEERQEVIHKAIKEISNLVKKGSLSEVQSKVKISAVEEAVKFSEKIKKDIGKAEIIAVKIIKGEKITSNEEKFINNKHPDIKRIVEETKKEVINLKSDLKNCKTNQEKQKLLLNVVNDFEYKNKKGLLNKTEIKIKMSALEEVEKFLKKDQQEVKKSELIAIKIIKGEKLTKPEEKFINERYPEIKQAAQEEIKEYKYLKEELKNYQNDEKKEEILSNKFNELKEQIKKDEISEIKARMKMAIIEGIKKENEIKENKKEESLNYYMNPYLYIFSNIFGNNLGIITVIIIVAIISVAYIF